MTGKQKELAEEYKSLLNQKGRHTYSQKRKAVHLARICSLENLLSSGPFHSGATEVYQEAQTIIQSERKKIWSFRFTKKNQINENNHSAFNYKNEDAIINVLGYIMQTNEEETFLYTGAFGLPLGAPDDMAAVFLSIQRLYSKDSGRRIRHECLSLTLEEAVDIEGKNRVIELCSRFALFYFYSGFQVIFSIHGTHSGFHAHYAVNTVSFYDGHKYLSSTKLLEYQQGYASSLIGTVTGKYTSASPITWEERAQKGEETITPQFIIR